MINDFIIKLGLKEGFDDNNNNLVCVDKNDIQVSPYVKASLIKYPEKLYKNQQEYKKLLNECIQDDREHFLTLGIKLSNQTRTIACQIMDEADRNSYVCSDLADFFCLGGNVSYEQLTLINSFHSLNYNVKDMVKNMQKITMQANKSDIKNYFNTLKNSFNYAFGLSEKGIIVLDQDLFSFREFLSDVEYEIFIKPIRKDPFHADNMSMLFDFLNYVIDNEYYPSKTYSYLIEKSSTKKEKLTHIRNMVSEVSDWYILMFHKNLKDGTL